MEQWLGDQYDVQGMDSLSGLISKRVCTCDQGGGAVGARQPHPMILKWLVPPAIIPADSLELTHRASGARLP